MIKIYIYLLLTGVTLSSCISVFKGYPTNSTQLNQANFHYIKQNVSGYSTAIYTFGIGGNSQNSMVAEAKSDLLATYPLGKNQALANVIVDFKFQSILGIIYGMKVCTYTADIVEFDNAVSVVQGITGLNSAKMASTAAPTSATKTIDSITNNGVYLFENSGTKERYATHADFTQTAKYEKLIYSSANTLVNSFYSDKGYFIPYIEELNYLYENISKYSFIPRKIFWSAETQDGKVKCFNMENGQTVLMDKNETAYIIPLFIIK
jgi:hypothetical protein